MLHLEATPRMMICAGVMKGLIDFSEREFVSRTLGFKKLPSALNI